MYHKKIHKVVHKKKPSRMSWHASAGLVCVAIVLVAVFFALGARDGGGPSGSGSNTKPGSTASKENLKILFGGDVFLDRAIRRAIEKQGVDYLWEDITPLLDSYPYKVANLEGPIWETPEAGALNTFTFAFQPAYVQKMKDLKFTAVSLANNHTLNQGQAGMDNTRKVLEAMKLPYFGSPTNVPERASLTMELEGRKVAFVGEHDLILSGQADMLSEVRRLKAAGNFVIVYPHWGAEYILTIPADERARAHALVDAGADLIIGAHPHVVQPIEIYNNKTIFYSLGNFLFDQYFSYDTMHGLLVGMEMNGRDITYTLYPTEQDATYQIHQAGTAARTKMLERIAKDSKVPEEVRTAIKTGSFSVNAQ